MLSVVGPNARRCTAKHPRLRIQCNLVDAHEGVHRAQAPSGYLWEWPNRSKSAVPW
jgi:hypothetical protein